MEDNQSTGVAAEGQSAFAATEPQTETAPASSPETKPTDTTPPAAEDKQPAAKQDVPWHQDPRWKEWQTEKQTLKAQLEELLPLKEVASKFNAQQPKIPSWFTRIYGEDQQAWEEYNGWNKSQRDEIKAEVLKEYESKQKQQQNAIANANKHFEESVAALESESPGEPVDRNKLLKFVQDNDLVDSHGNWNYKSGFKFMRDLAKATREAQAGPITDAKKATSDQSVSGSKEKKAKNYETPSSLKGRSWLSL